MNIWVILRVGLCTLFVVSGGEKLIAPYVDFLYKVQSYELLFGTADALVARYLPWIELFVGVFIFLGLWLKPALRVLQLLLLAFIVVVSQAILRKLPINECGCFGDLIQFPLSFVLIMDSAMLVLAQILIRKIKSISSFSLDRFFDDKKI